MLTRHELLSVCCSIKCQYITHPTISCLQDTQLHHNSLGKVTAYFIANPSPVTVSEVCEHFTAANGSPFDFLDQC